MFSLLNITKIHCSLNRKLWGNVFILRLIWLKMKMKELGRNCALSLNASNRSLRMFISSLKRWCFVLIVVVFTSIKRMWRINQLMYVFIWHPLHAALVYTGYIFTKTGTKYFELWFSKTILQHLNLQKNLIFSFRKLLSCPTFSTFSKMWRILKYWPLNLGLPLGIGSRSCICCKSSSGLGSVLPQNSWP